MITVPTKTVGHYRALCMMRDRIQGMSYKDVGLYYGVSPRMASSHVKKMAYEMMLKAMENVKGNPDGPRVTHFTVDVFNDKKGGPMGVMMNKTIEELEAAYPSLKED